MKRQELKHSDSELITLLFQGYGIRAKKLKFIEIGSYFSFLVDDETSKKYFLKIYPQHKHFSPVGRMSAQKIAETGIVLERLREEFSLSTIPRILSTRRGAFYFKTADFLITLCDYIEGVHPSYSPNKLRSEELAKVFSLLHHIPCEEFPGLPREDFESRYALGISKWLNDEKGEESKKEMCAFFKKNTEGILRGITLMSTLQKQFKIQQIPFVLTHGDGHHFNVLQNDKEVFLIDWDGIKIAPRERDLWHYENAPLMVYYRSLNPGFVLDQDLCRFYAWQRFFEDLRYYLEQDYASEEQAQEDRHTFMAHWGWTTCIKMD